MRWWGLTVHRVFDVGGVVGDDEPVGAGAHFGEPGGGERGWRAPHNEFDSEPLVFDGYAFHFFALNFV